MPFDIEEATTCFLECYKGDFNLDAYNQGYEQLYSLFVSLGKVFGFIGQDVREKIDILVDFNKNSEKKEHYEKVETMMVLEKEVHKETKAVLFGSRTLLRLHRALKFTMLLLERLAAVEDDSNIGPLASSAYSDSLAQFHPWLVRQPAKLAMYTLPNRKGFLQTISPGIVLDKTKVDEKLLAFVDSLRPVYEGCEQLYTKYDLHGLP